MASSNNSNQKGLGRLILIGFIVAAIAVAVIYYIGWFDSRTHVDTPAGDNVEDIYEPANSGSQAEESWENASHESLDQVITEGN